MDKYCELMKLAQSCRDCRKCAIGGIKYDQIQDGMVVQSFKSNVFSNRNLTADIMVIGQNPGWDEMRWETPFVGASGKFFEGAIQEVAGLERSRLYISNVVRCYTPENRKPRSYEVDNCQHILDREIEIIKPRIIIALGSMAFAQLTGMNCIMKHHGEIVTSPRYKVPVIAVLHPSPLNLNNPERKVAFYSDLQNLKHWMENGR